MWNPHCRQKQNAGPLEEVIETYELLVDNDMDFSTRPGSRGMFIIDLALTSPALGLLWVWEILEEYPFLSDHELMMLEWEDIGVESQENQQPAMNGWIIQNLLQDKTFWQTAKDKWENSNTGPGGLTQQSTKEDLEKEVEWFESKIVTLLNNYAKITKICAYSKRWWNEEVAEARKR